MAIPQNSSVFNGVYLRPARLLKIPTRNFELVMKLLDLILMLHIVPSMRRLEFTLLSFTMPLPGPLIQRKRYETLYVAQTGREDFLFMSVIDLPFSFLLSMVGSRRLFLFRSFQYFELMAELVLGK